MSEPTVQVLDHRGAPMTRQARPRATMLAGGSNVPYDAAGDSGDHMVGWQPFLGSPDGELNIYRDHIVSRVRDIVRNDGWASGAITRVLDNAIGAKYRPIAKPDWRALAGYTGNAGFTSEWAYEFAKAAEGVYRTWANDLGRYCDSARALTIAQIMRLAFRHKLVDGDALAILPWLPRRVAPGRARYATCVQLIDPDRLSNPQLAFDKRDLRGGVEIDHFGAAVAYHIRRAHQGDWWAAADSLTWDRIPRETGWGRPIVVHDYDHDRASQHRGGAGILTPVLQRLKMLVRYDGAELDAALLNAIFGSYIESPFDPAMVESALGEADLSATALPSYQDDRATFYEDRRINLGGARIPTLFPGEKITAVSAERPSGNFAAFEKAVLRNVAAAVGLSAQQVSNDWSDVNYSSARGAMLEFWKTMTRRRDDFAAGFSQPIYAAFLEEAMELDELPLPAGAPDFFECRTAYAGAQWIGPGRGWIDPVDEVKGAVLGMDGALMSYDQVCAEQGNDPDEMVEARARDIRRFKEAGIPPPSWAMMNPQGAPNGQPASQTITDPDVV